MAMAMSMSTMLSQWTRITTSKHLEAGTYTSHSSSASSVGSSLEDNAEKDPKFFDAPDVVLGAGAGAGLTGCAAGFWLSLIGADVCSSPDEADDTCLFFLALTDLLCTV